jgi:hypothetical protein
MKELRANLHQPRARLVGVPAIGIEWCGLGCERMDA